MPAFAVMGVRPVANRYGSLACPWMRSLTIPTDRFARSFIASRPDDSWVGGTALQAYQLSA